MDLLFLSSSVHPESFSNLLETLLDEQEKNKKLITLIIERIYHLANNGGHPQPPNAKPLREVDGELCEIRIKYVEKKLLRIYYFVDKKEKKMFLLNYILKPDLYEKAVKKKTVKKIDESIQLALTLKKSLPEHYEPF